MKTEKHTLIETAVENELTSAEEFLAAGDTRSAFHHLERAHALGQASTFHHTRIHWRMLKLAFRLRSVREIWGQIIRIIGASTKTPFGIYPTGNTGGSNVWFFKKMPVPEDIEEIMNQSRR